MGRKEWEKTGRGRENMAPECGRMGDGEGEMNQVERKACVRAPGVVILYAGPRLGQVKPISTGQLPLLLSTFMPLNFRNYYPICRGCLKQIVKCFKYKNLFCDSNMVVF